MNRNHAIKLNEGYDILTRNSVTIADIEREMIITRFFDAPPELVFKAYTDQNLIPHWWGSKRLTTTSVIKMDVRPGGIWRFVQLDSEGNEYIFNGMYHEIVPPKRLVYTFEFEGMPGHVTVEKVMFEEEEEEHGSKTKLTSESFFQTVEDRDIMLNLLRVGGGMAARMDRLAGLLKDIRSTDGQ